MFSLRNFEKTLFGTPPFGAFPSLTTITTHHHTHYSPLTTTNARPDISKCTRQLLINHQSTDRKISFPIKTQCTYVKDTLPHRTFQDDLLTKIAHQTFHVGSSKKKSRSYVNTS